MSWRFAVILICSAASLSAQQTGQPSAKDLYFSRSIVSDKNSGATVVSTAEKRSKQQDSGKVADQKKPQNTKQSAASLVNSISGLRYWVELVKKDGTSERVAANRIFQSGERIRMHLQSNIDGRLLIAQRLPNGGAEILFPDKRVNGGNSVVRANTDVLVPSDRAWFRFDHNAGDERLMVFLASESEYKALSSEIQGSRISESRTLTLASEVKDLSRGLVVETDKSDTFAVSYGDREEANKSGGRTQTLAVEIVLRHQ